MNLEITQPERFSPSPSLKGCKASGELRAGVHESDTIEDLPSYLVA